MTAEQLALEGMTSSIRHAESANPGWDEAAYHAIVNYARTAPAPFMIEDVRKVAYENGMPRPPVEGAWGTPTRRAAKHGVIKHIGYMPSANASQHGKPCKIWESLVGYQND